MLKTYSSYLMLLWLLFFLPPSAPGQQVQEGDHAVATVTGPISASEMGPTLIHEHVLVDWIGADSTGYHRWNRQKVIDKVLPYFREAKEQGIRTILECTPAYLGRDPFLLQELARRSGINILTNTGYYGAVDNKFMPQHAWQESAETISRRWIDEFENGIDGSDIRPGFIKISVRGDAPLSSLHQKIVRAAALTHLATGLTIVSHTTGDEPALGQLDILEEAGVSPAAWVWTHSQAGTLEAQIKIGRAGGWISLDNFNHNSSEEPPSNSNLEWFIERLSKLREAGLLHRVLISHDAGYYNPDEVNGGEFRGYTDISKHLLPALREHGFTTAEINRLMVENPQQAYGIRIRNGNPN
ncbi:phosphotriesterase family protein [Fodinibius sediminis]|uniref:Phosphotriesterase-related protein n=1 Tax=Fodinibius sediminis TaxID=1214077 RepID=A0A521F2F6_9BACT|nr:hypothetical protein [Fodinibius sediminis]SMO90369.1 phosphotriesterase-related protein [Fodinibius sediminis]